MATTDTVLPIGKSAPQLFPEVWDWTQPGTFVKFEHPSPFLDKAYLNALSQITELGKLQEGWDSYRGNKIDEAARSNASAFVTMLATHLHNPVPPPVVGPSADGGVVLRWEPPDLEVVVKLLSHGGEYYVARRDEESLLAEDEVGSLESLVDIIAKFLTT